MISVIAIFFLVIALLIGVLLLIRMVVSGRLGQTWFKKMGLQPRNLEVMESLVLDPKRRLVVVRHAEASYLILLGNTTETVLKGPYDALEAVTAHDSIDPVHDVAHDRAHEHGYDLVQKANA
jgi:flagellar biogenesis protein FliO